MAVTDTPTREALEKSHADLLEALEIAREVMRVACGETAPYIREAFKRIDPAIANAKRLTQGTEPASAKATEDRS